ncbi:MAG: hypothetical protein VKK04_26560 [Synechococcales bacterium]|nr:hypothetical protein [Synechococcales bacterium]
MLSQHRKPICLSLMSFDLPIWSVVETAATLYQKDADQFHILLTEPVVRERSPQDEPEGRVLTSTTPSPRLLWLEISPYRVTMTMQGNGRFSYRHFWEEGVYGINRYWLQGSSAAKAEQVRLRNFTRSLKLTGDDLPQHLRLEYELWSQQLCLGHYVMNLDIR